MRYKRRKPYKGLKKSFCKDSKPLQTNVRPDSFQGRLNAMVNRGSKE